MPNYTPNLNLIKPLATESFSVNNDNSNADILDSNIFNNTSNIREVDGSIAIATDLNATMPIGKFISRRTNASTLNTPFAAGQTGGANAGIVDIYYSNATNAVQIYQMSGQTGGRNYTFRRYLGAGVWSVWKRMLDIDDYDTLFQFANDGKTQIANAVNDKGVPATSADTFPTLATKIGQISTGKKFATGQVVSNTASSYQQAGSTTVVNFGDAIVSGLTFLPSTIILNGIGSFNNMTVYKRESDGSFTDTAKVFTYNNGVLNTNVNNLKGNTLPAYVNATGFKLPVSSGSTCTWYAYE